MLKKEKRKKKKKKKDSSWADETPFIFRDIQKMIQK